MMQSKTIQSMKTRRRKRKKRPAAIFVGPLIVTMIGIFAVLSMWSLGLAFVYVFGETQANTTRA